MASAARQRYSAYDYEAWSSSAAVDLQQPQQAPRPNRNPQSQPRRNWRVIPGEGRSAQHAPKLSMAAVHGFKAAMAIVVVLAVVCLARVFMSVSTVQAMEASASLQTQIEEARATGNELEIQHSVLSNPTTIQKKAAKIGMSAPKNTERLTVVVKPSTKTFADGSISISKTLKTITDYAVGLK